VLPPSYIATMADDPGGEEAEDERLLELSTIAAIYPELLVDPDGFHPFSASIQVGIEPIAPLLLRFQTVDGIPPVGLLTPPDSISTGNESATADHQGGHAQNVHQLSHLPPLDLHISLPEGYPAQKPPVVNLDSQYSWLPETKIQELRESGLKIWEDMGRDQVVFSYIDYLREAADRGFDLLESGAGALDVAAELKIPLLDYDLKAKLMKFDQGTFECGICLGMTLLILSREQLQLIIYRRTEEGCGVPSPPPLLTRLLC
jgi:E3 ubiquitin-protein ligase RNF14